MAVSCDTADGAPPSYGTRPLAGIGGSKANAVNSQLAPQSQRVGEGVYGPIGQYFWARGCVEYGRRGAKVTDHRYLLQCYLGFYAVFSRTETICGTMGKQLSDRLGWMFHVVVYMLVAVCLSISTVTAQDSPRVSISAPDEVIEGESLVFQVRLLDELDAVLHVPYTIRVSKNKSNKSLLWTDNSGCRENCKLTFTAGPETKKIIIDTKQSLLANAAYVMVTLEDKRLTDGEASRFSIDGTNIANGSVVDERNFIVLMNKTVLANGLTLGFVSIILVIFAFGIVLIWNCKTSLQRWAQGVVSVTPGTLATLGILGTFTGILLGLFDFDPDNISESVPNLLDGLTVAFSSSIFGIGAAVVFRYSRAFFSRKEHVDDVSPSDIHTTLMEIRDFVKEASEASSKQVTALVDMGKDARESMESSSKTIADIRAAISSEGDSSLLTKIQELRTDENSNHERMIGEFQDFSNHMVENNQKAIVKALEKVIGGFNQNLTDQFGDNFKKLNEAVHELVNWQNNYKIHVETLEQNIQNAVAALESTSSSIKCIEDSARKIPDAISHLEPVLIGVDEKIGILEEHMETIANLRDKVLDAFPVIEGNLDRLTTELTVSIERTVQSASSAIEDGQRGLQNIQKQHAELLEGTTKLHQELLSSLGRSSSNFLEQSSAMAEQQRKVVDDLTDSISNNVKDSLSEFSDGVDKTMKQIASVLDDGRKGYEQLQESYSKILDGITGLCESFILKLQSTVNGMANKSADAFERQQKHAEDMAATTDKEIREMLTQNTERMKGQFCEFDRQMQEEIGNAITELANEIVSINEKFIKDYTKLAEALRRIRSLEQSIVGQAVSPPE